MSQINSPPNSTKDDQLADFTDLVLAGKIKQAEASADEELLALEETVLRLKNAFPATDMDQAMLKKMHVRFNARVKRESQATKQPFWKKWFEPQTRPQFAIAFAAMAILVIFAIVSPATTPVIGSPLSATALNPVNGVFSILALAGILAIFFWIKRRK